MPGCRYLKAAELFEEAAKRAVDNNLLKFSARGYLLQAGICLLCILPPDDLEIKLDKYRDIDLQVRMRLHGRPHAHAHAHAHARKEGACMQVEVAGASLSPHRTAGVPGQACVVCWVGLHGALYGQRQAAAPAT